MNVHRLFWPVYVCLVAFIMLYACGVKAQTVRTGETHTGIIAVCDTLPDAATLIGITTAYGQQTGMGFMQESDNTCALVPTTFTVGEVEVDGIKGKDGTVWLILGITIEGKPAYVVAPAALYQATSY